MANTSTHPITVNGTRLDTWAYNIKTKDGMVIIPNLRGDNAVVPGKHGELWTPNKRRDPGEIILSMWIRDRDVDDVLPASNPYYAWRQNLDTVLRLFNSPYALLDVRQTLDTGVVRQAFCEVKGISDPVMRGERYGELKVSLSIPDSFWQDTATTDYDSTAGVANAIKTHSLTAYSGATAPMEDLQFVVDGPLTNARLTDIASGHYVQLNFALPGTDQWMVDTSTWSSKTGAGIAFTTNGTIRTSVTQAVGAMLPRLFGIAPTSPPSVSLSGTGASTTTRLRIRNRRKYL